MECYVHSVPGRLRVRSQRFKNADLQDAVKRVLVSDIGHGIATVDFNGTTGSMLVRYNPAEVDHRHILSILEGAGYYDSSRIVSNDQLVHSATSKAMHLVTKSVTGAFLETALHGTGLSFLAVLL